MKKQRAIALFSGGKDSMYSVLVGALKYEIVALVLITTNAGDVQMTDGLEVKSKIVRDIASTLPFPYEEIIIENGEHYIDDLALRMQEKMTEHNAEILITGDLDHPDGIDKILKKKVGIISQSPAGDFFKKFGPDAYIREIENKGIKLVVSGIRGESLPLDLIGKDFDKDAVAIIKGKGLDITGEDGEFQTLVGKAPIMNKKVRINHFSIDQAQGRDSYGYVYARMTNVDYSLENK